MDKTGRNDPCPCGSGLKYKRCCLKAQQPNVEQLAVQRFKRIDKELISKLMRHFAEFYGEEAHDLAVSEFLLWPDEDDVHNFPFDVGLIAIPWMLFNWEPDVDDEGVFSFDFPQQKVVDHFIATQRNRLKADEIAFLECAGRTQYSLHKVIDVQAGYSVTLQDMLLGTESEVHDVSMSRTITDGMIVFARLVELPRTPGHGIFDGVGEVAIPPQMINAVIELRDVINTHPDIELKRKAGDHPAAPWLAIEDLYEFDMSLREFYFSMVEQLQHPAPLQLRNSDGEEIVFITLHYRLSCTPREALEALATLNGKTSAEKLIEQYGDDDEDAEKLEAIRFPWLNTYDTVYGEIDIDGEHLTVEINSTERAESIQRRISRRLGKRASLMDTTIHDMDELSAGQTSVEKDDESMSQEELMALPEVQAKIKELTDRHWSSWPDIPLPALNGMTPREAAKTDSGRERLEALFDQFEQSNATSNLLHNGIQPPVAPIGKLRKELGLA